MTRGIDWFAAMSAGLAQEAQRQLGHPRVATLYDPNIPDDAPLDFTPRAALASDAPVRLIAIGRLEPQKDWSLAFRTVAELRKSRPVQLDIYGEGWQRNRLEREIAALGLSDCIRLAGFTDDLPSAMRAADLLLISSRYEGGPVVAVEALAQGLPLASTDCSHFLREVLHDPSLGTLARAATPVALAQAASTQLAHPGPSPAAVARAIAPVRMGHAAQAYLDLFDRVSAQAAGQPGSARA